MKILTLKQKVVLKAIKSFLMKNGRSPSIRELQEEMNKHGLRVKSSRSVFRYLNSLESEGFIKRSSKRKGVELKVPRKESFVDVPVYGSANAGKPTMVAEQNMEGYLKISTRLVNKKDIFAIQVFGNSMDECKINGKNIEDGDYILVETGKFNVGDKVLAIIDGLATVKSLARIDKKTMVLLPISSNKKNQPIYLTQEDDFLINGRVIEVLKRPKGEKPKY